MMLNDSYGMVPGLTTARETYEQAFQWGSEYQAVFAGALISGATRDSGNSPTYELRPGLLLGQIISSGLYTNYSPTATDGSEVASAILMEGFRVLDFDGNNKNIFYAVLVGGPVQASKILNLDLMARQQMDKFIFDDIFNVQGNHFYPYKRFQTKTANYTIVANDNFTHFDNTGAGGSVTLTLPPIANGYMFELRCVTAQTFAFTSNEGSNIVGQTNATGSTISVNTIGGGVRLWSNAAGTKWFAENASAGSNAVSIS